MTRILTIVGEAATRLSSERREQLSQIPWRRIIGLRNVLMHMYHNIDYHNIDDSSLWQILSVDVPKLVLELEELDLPKEAE